MILYENHTIVHYVAKKKFLSSKEHPQSFR